MEAGDFTVEIDQASFRRDEHLDRGPECLRQPAGQGNGSRPLGGIGEAEPGAFEVQDFGHPHQGRNADSAGDQQVIRRAADERKKRLGRRDAHRVAGL